MDLWIRSQDKLWTALIIAIIIIFGQAFIIAFGVDLINDLKDTANSYKNSENICEMKLDSLIQDYRRLQDDQNG